MKGKRVAIIAVQIVMAAAAFSVQAQSSQPQHPRMAPLDRYLIADRNAEIALARSAAPPSVSNKAEIMVLGRHGFEVAVPGSNHFVCLVERSWDAAVGSPKFWDPESRGPDCLNEAAAKSYLPIVFMKTRLVLAGKSETQIGEAVQTAFNQGKLPSMEPGAMSYMLSRQADFGGGSGNWHPHLMFFVPFSLRTTWGANLPGSPMLAADDAPDRLTIFILPVARWSDGTADPRAGN